MSTMEAVWATLDRMSEDMAELRALHKETERSIALFSEETKKNLTALFKAQGRTEEALGRLSNKQVDIALFSEETKKNLTALSKAQDRTEEALGRLSNKQGDIAEATLIPDLEQKFESLGFTFSQISRRRKYIDRAHDIQTEADALLENASAAMVVEVKATLRRDDVDYHLWRMGEVRRYADLRGDKRKYFGAIAALVVDEDAKRYALKQGFFLVEPSGEDVKVTPPPLEARAW